MNRLLPAFTIVTSILAMATLADAQPLGSFRWQLQPYCNIVTVVVTQVGSVYRLEGTDDRCGAGADQSSVIGTAFPNPDGTIGFGLNIVSTPGGFPVPVDAAIALSTLSGTWRDGGGNSGSFVLTPGAGTGGSPRPTSSPSVIPSNFGFLTDGGFVARGTFGTGTAPAGNIGTRMMWYPGKSAFRAGTVTGPYWDDANIGVYSTALGFDAIATGAYSTALGAITSATAPSSTAMGQETQATGAFSTSMGFGTIASGTTSTAMGAGTRAQGARSTSMGVNTVANGTNSVATGESTTASGPNSMAMGYTTVASGVNAVAMGSGTLASGAYSLAGGSNAAAANTSTFAFGNAHARFVGSFVWGDTATSTRQLDFAPNQFVVRATGGVGFYTNVANTIGVELPIGGGGWTVLSDRNAKEQFRDLDSEDLLAKIARMSIPEWSYKDQPGSVRHIGPMAQDFHAAFGLGENPLRINMIDADGVALAAAQALEARTRALDERSQRLERENAELRERVEKLERLLRRP